MKKNSIIWGILFILIGVAILLRSFDVIFFSWGALWKMWPFLFVFLGISLLPSKGYIKSILHIVALACMFGLMLYISKDYPRDRYSRFWNGLSWHIDREIFDDLSEELKNSDQTIYCTFVDTVYSVTINAEFVPGVYKITGKSKTNNIKLFFQENEYTSSLHSKGNEGFINLHPKLKYGSNFSGGTINLDEKKSYTLNLSSDEANMNLDLSHIKTDTLRIDAGANSLWSVVLSDKKPECHIFLEAENMAKEISLTIPSRMGYQLSTTSETITEEGFLEESDLTIKSENFEGSSSKIFVTTNNSLNVTIIQK
ncbi:MAG: DUF5668 domain-containing protein [Bacteroidales bacterium]|jgi:hypothetical protein|nr:DUF5668 domain-containing protein [Bacteroidales bacterium]